MSKWRFCTMYYTLHGLGCLMLGFGMGVDFTLRRNLSATVGNVLTYSGIIFILIVAVCFRKEFKEFKNYLKKS